jgi:hypothetical protein
VQVAGTAQVGTNEALLWLVDDGGGRIEVRNASVPLEWQ